MTTNNKISNLVNSQVPFFVRNDHPTFIRFLELYYEYLEQDGKLVERSKNFRYYKDIDRTIDEFTDHFYNTYLKLIPENILADRKLLLKHVQDLYRARGTEKSVKFLLNIMFGEQDVSFYYPKKDVLKASDGKWFIQKTLRVNDTFIDGSSNTHLSGLSKFTATNIKGNTSNATAVVERVDRFFEQGTKVDELVLSNIKGNFENGETVFATYVEENIVKTARANVFGGILNAVTILNGGTGYQVGSHPVIFNETGINGNLRIDQVTTGNIASITVVEGGAGYRIDDFVFFSGGGGTGANANVITVLSNSSIHPNSYNIVVSTISLEANTAINNTTYPNLNASNSAVTRNTTLANAFTTFKYSNTGPVRTIQVISPGTNFTGVPSISILANTRVQELGILGRMKIEDGGLNYVINNVITFTNVIGGGGVGGLARVSNVAANGKITEVKFVEMTGHIIGGAGYIDSLTKVPKYPTANVVTSTGNGANITVTALLGEGGNYIVANTTLGAIQKMSIIDRGTGYTGFANVDMTTLGDGKANVEVSVLEGVFTYPGRYLNDDGFLSSYNFLQDRDYYQNFSYVVKVKASIENYRKALKDLLHPAGMKLYGQYLTIDEQDDMSSSDGGVEAVAQSLPIPTLSLDFITGNLDSNVTFTRSSSGSYVGSDGYIEYAGVNVPRFTHASETLRPLGIQIEPQATNLLRYSNNFTAFWSNNGNTIITSGFKSPDGSNNAFLLYDSNLNNDASFIDQNITITPSATQRHTHSIFAKANTANAFAIFCFYTGTTVNGSSVIVNNFNTNNPTVTAAIAEGGEELPSNVVLENYIDGWKRLSFTTFNRNGLNNNIVFRIYPATRDPGITGATLFFGPQLETGNVATTYIPTGSATVTRSSDYLAVQNTAFTNVFNRTEGTVYVQGSTIDYVVNNGDYPVAIALANSFSRDTNCIVFGSDRTSNPPANDVFMSVVKNGYANLNIELNKSYVGKSFRAAFAYEDGNLPSGNAILVLDGIASNKGTANIPNVNILYISQTARFQPQYPHNIEKVVYYNKELSNTTMIQLTTKP